MAHGNWYNNAQLVISVMTHNDDCWCNPFLQEDKDEKGDEEKEVEEDEDDEGENDEVILKISVFGIPYM